MTIELTELVPFPELLLRGAAAHPERDFMVVSADRVTYAEATARARQVARSLLALGIERGDAVGILSANCLEFTDVLFGAALIGAVPVMYNARFKAREISHVTTDSEVKVLFTTDIIEQHTNYAHLLHEAIPGLSEQADPAKITGLASAPALRAAVLLGSTSALGFMDPQAFYALGAAPDDPSCDDAAVDVRRRETTIDDIAAMFYTSGTTAMPKGCPLSHLSLQYAGIISSGDRLQMVAGDTVWDPLPMFHTAFSQPLMGTMHHGGTFVSMTHFEAGAALQMIRDESATVLFPAFPTIHLALLQHPDYTEASFANVRMVFNVGPAGVLREMQALMPGSIQVTAFGMTETGGSVVMCEPADDVTTRSETSGRALPGTEVQIRDPESAANMGADQKGEIVVRGPGVFGGYYKDPAKTAEAIDPDGWFHTGDLGSLDADGRLTFHGRLKDMLKVGGENVACVEIESYLATHPAVSLSQVVGLSDAKYQEVPVAFVELKTGASASETELIEFCVGAMASFKVPRHVRFVTEWPMGATKILKYELRDQIERELG